MTGRNFERMYEHSIEFITEFERGQQFGFKAVNAFISSLRNNASIPALIRRFTQDDTLDRGVFKKSVIQAEMLMEKLMARRYLDGDEACVPCHLEGGYTMARKEVQALNLNRENWLYFVGCGAAPFTAMLYYDVCQARVVCVDRDLEALDLAKAVLFKRYGRKVFDAHFRFIHCPAEELVFAPLSIRHLILAAHCRKKEEILAYLDGALADDCHILVRQPLGLYRYVYDVVEFSLCPGFQVLETISDPSEPFCHVSLLMPRRGLEGKMLKYGT